MLFKSFWANLLSSRRAARQWLSTFFIPPPRHHIILFPTRVLRYISKRISSQMNPTPLVADPAGLHILYAHVHRQRQQ